MIIRQLRKSDFESYLTLINEFRPIGLDINKEKFEEIYDNIFKNSIIYVLTLNNEIIGSSKLIIEQKFIHKLAKYGHIEDVIIKEEYRRRGYGTQIINHIVNYCKNKNFFKITLTCKEKLIPFYKTCKFDVYDTHMSILL